MQRLKKGIPTVIVIIVAVLINVYIIGISFVSGDSMNDTLKEGDVLAAQKFALVNSIDRFDVITFKHYYHDKTYEYFIKRVIGLPGETVQIIENNIYINGELLEENYGKEKISFKGIAAEKITLKEDEYFVMGDNRNESFDSRYEEVGPIKVKDIEAKMVCRILPLFKGL